MDLFGFPADAQAAMRDGYRFLLSRDHPFITPAGAIAVTHSISSITGFCFKGLVFG
jgi:hypothetical protein